MDHDRPAFGAVKRLGGVLTGVAICVATIYAAYFLAKYGLHARGNAQVGSVPIFPFPSIPVLQGMAGAALLIRARTDYLRCAGAGLSVGAVLLLSVAAFVQSGGISGE